MARPQKQGLDYFPHDTDAINDPKIQRLVSKFGIAGYGFYFALLEEIYAEMPAKFQWNADENSARVSRKLHVRITYSERILNHCLSIGLFDKAAFDEDSSLTSTSIYARATSILDSRERKRKERLSQGLSQGLSSISPPQSKLNQSKTKDKENIREDIDDDKIESLKKDEEQSPELAAVIDAFERCGGVVSSQMIALELADAEREYGADIVIAAFRRASLAGKQGTRLTSYCKPIYEDFKANGIPSEKGMSPGRRKLPSEPNPLKYTTGKYAHLFNRTKEDLERHAEEKRLGLEEENGVNNANRS